jgi:prepilin-type N-terminal cleavage/methylation domain-containing protein
MRVVCNLLKIVPDFVWRIFKMRERGLTLAELVIVLVLIGALAAFGYPRLADVWVRQSVRSARAALAGFYAKGRATAIERGAVARVIVENSRVRIESVNPVTGATVIVGGVEDLNARYGVTISPSVDTCLYDPRGVARKAGETVLTISRGTAVRTLRINQLGRVIQ